MSCNQRCLLLKNVRTLLSASSGWFRDEIIKTIEGLGYYVDYGVLNASHFGVPKLVKELYLFVQRKKDNTTYKNCKIFNNSKRCYIGFGIFEFRRRGTFEQDYMLPATSSYQKLMRTGSAKLYNHMASNHKQIAIDKLKMIPPEKGKECLPEDMIGNQKFKTTWGRLKWDEVSPTIDTRFDAASNGTNNHPFLHRAITPREAARLQSFDDNFIFCGSKVRIRKQIGNAVPPLMAKAIADKIYNDLN